MKDRYRLVRPLATGGMAELFLGISQGAEGFEKHVAIKRMLPHLAKDEAVVRMFLSEARLATHLHHQNIATVHDVGSNDAGLFLVMELVDGWDLGELMRYVKRRGLRFPPHLVAFIGAQVLAGLIHAYRRTHNGQPVLTAHRDISPSNILVSREGEVKVTDFGIAKLAGVSQGTQPGIFKGKPSYSSPETVSGLPATAASDQFSLGIVLHELLSGMHPFSAATDAIAVAMAIATSEPFPLPDVPEPLVEVVMRALSKQPEARFPQPEAMAEALARYLARTGEPATSNALAAFIAGLSMPPTLLEMGKGPPGAPVGASASAPSPPPELSHSFELIIDEAPAPRSPAPPPSGQLTPMSAKELSTADTLPRANLPRPPSPVERPPEPVEPPPAPLRQASAPLELEVPDAPSEPLELVERAPTWEPPPPRRSPGRWLLLLGGLAVLAAGGVLGFPRLQPLLARLPLEGQTVSLPTLSIHSHPEGARVVVQGETLGTTPLVMDNAYPPGEVSVQVTLPGYKPWKGTFTGGEPATLEVRLQKR